MWTLLAVKKLVDLKKENHVFKEDNSNFSWQRISFNWKIKLYDVKIFQLTQINKAANKWRILNEKRTKEKRKITAGKHIFHKLVIG